VVGVVEWRSRKCAMFSVPNKTAATLLPIIHKNCFPGTIIIVECWSSYRILTKDHTFYHLTVNHSLTLYLK
jgi:hypothetical protein